MATHETFEHYVTCPVCGSAKGILETEFSPNHAFGKVHYAVEFKCACGDAWRVRRIADSFEVTSEDDKDVINKLKEREGWLLQSLNALYRAAAGMMLLERWGNNPNQHRTRRAQHETLQSLVLYTGSYEDYCAQIRDPSAPKRFDDLYEAVATAMMVVRWSGGLDDALALKLAKRAGVEALVDALRREVKAIRTSLGCARFRRFLVRDNGDVAEATTTWGERYGKDTSASSVEALALGLAQFPELKTMFTGFTR